MSKSIFTFLRITLFTSVSLFSSLVVALDIIPLEVDVHIQGVGDLRSTDSVWVGTKGESRRLELINVEMIEPPEGLRLKYLCHIQGTGDSEWLDEGRDCGSTAKSLRLEGVAFKLVGEESDKYQVSYSCHIQGHGDLGEYRNGEYCGTRGKSKRLEALIVSVTKKPE